MEILDLYNKYNEYGRAMDMDFDVIEPGKIVYRVKISKKHLATPFAAHGGVIAAFMDAVLGVAALSAVAQDLKVVSTVEFKINYFAPVLLDDELEGYGVVLQKGNRIIISEGSIHVVNRDNICVSKAMGTFNAYPAEKIGFNK